MFPNLKAEMARYGIDSKTMSESLNLNYKTIVNKLNGKTEFTRIEMFNIRRIFFPDMKIDYLFEMTKETA